MTYRKPTKCGFFCNLARIIRHNRWLNMAKPISQKVRVESYPAILKHFM